MVYCYDKTHFYFFFRFYEHLRPLALSPVCVHMAHLVHEVFPLLSPANMFCVWEEMFT